MSILFADNYASTLSSGINATDVSMSVVSATGLPSMTSNDWFYATLSNSTETIWEVIKVTAVSGTTFTIVRYNGAIWANGSNISMRPCTKAMQDTINASNYMIPSTMGDGNITTFLHDGIKPIYCNDWQGTQLLYSTTRTNLLTYSKLTGGTTPTGWLLGSGTPTIKTSTLYTGDGAIAFGFAATGGATYIQRTDSYLANTTYRCSIFVESITGTIQATQIMCQIASPVGSSLIWPVCSANLSGGSTGSITIGRLEVDFVVAGTAGTSQIRIGMGTMGSVTGSCRLSRPQIEITSIISSYIPTTSAAVTVTDYTTANGVAILATAPLITSILYGISYGGSLADTSNIANGDALLGVLQPYAGAVATNQHKKNACIVDLEDFGVVDKTGTADCSAVLALAKAALSGVDGIIGGVINLPMGTLKGNIALDGYPITLRGKGKRSTILIPAINAPTVSIGHVSNSMIDCHIEEMGFNNPSGIATGSTPAISFINTLQINDNHVLKNLFVSYFPYGVSITGRCILSQFEGVEVLFSGINGFRVEPYATGVSINHLKFTNCRSYVSQSHGMYLKSWGSGGAPTIIGVNFDHCDFEQSGCSAVGVPLTTNGICGLYSDGVEGLTITDENYFENNGEGAADNLGCGIHIAGTYGMWFRIANCISWATQNAIKVSATLANGYIGENRLGGSRSTLDINTTHASSNIVIGPNYDEGTHIISRDSFQRTFTQFLNQTTTRATVYKAISDGISAKDISYMYCTNTSPITMNTIIDGEHGQELTIKAGADTITFTHSNNSTNGFTFDDFTTHILPAYGTVKFIRTIGFQGWICIDSTMFDSRTPAAMGDGTTVTFLHDGIKPIYLKDWQGTRLLYTTARTNKCLRSQDWSTIWSKEYGTGSQTANTIGPDGVASSATTIADTDAATVTDYLQQVTVPADTSIYSFSVYIKKVIGTPSAYPALQITHSADSVLALIGINTQTGTIVTTPWLSDSSSCESVGNYWRVTITKANNGGTITRLRLFPAYNTDGTGAFSVAATGSNVFFGAQLEVGSTATPYIATTSAAVTVTDYTTASGIATLVVAPLTTSTVYGVSDHLRASADGTIGLTATKTFYGSATSGGTVTVLNTIGIKNGLITSWTQA